MVDTVGKKRVISLIRPKGIGSNPIVSDKCLNDGTVVMLALEASVERRVGSNPTWGTISSLTCYY